MANTDKKRTSKKTFHGSNTVLNTTRKAVRVYKRITAYAFWWFKKSTPEGEAEDARNERLKRFKQIRERARTEALRCAEAHGTQVMDNVTRTLQSR